MALRLDNDDDGDDIVENTTSLTYHTDGMKVLDAALRYVEQQSSASPTDVMRLHGFNIVSSPNCELCVHVEETISHILFHCPRYRDTRLQILKEIQYLNRVYFDTSLQPVKFGQECEDQAEST
ncbi:hypothetical protein AVEN_97096-1 [Araneus ventricosus]|uniref:Uncharacterized protein n=1 Tax=Araneus ventricosus TaxID=182803 RepID=A0A4Y2SKW9_ARAVE|nr:hypothetical protein AVEN_97096-1 [Araneus ventricosus]